MPKNISTIIANLVGIDKMKTEEMTTKLAEKKMQENGMDIAMPGSIFIGFSYRSIFWFSIFIGLFQRGKMPFRRSTSPF